MLIAQGKNNTEVATAVGVSRRTVYTWIHLDKEFRHLLKEVRAKMFNEEFSRVRSLSGEALDRLAKLTKSENEAIALKAIQLVLDNSGFSKVY